MEKRNLKRLGDSYKHRKEYEAVTNVIWKEVEHRVRNVMQTNPETAILENQILENNKTFFDRKEELAFQVNYGFTDDYGEDYLDFNYSQDLYDNYQYYLNNFDKILENLNNQKKKLETGFHFNKKKKLMEIDSKIESENKQYKYYMSIREREKKFEETWFKDGKFVDLNKDAKERLASIREDAVKKLIEECFNKHPELMIYDFDGLKFRKDVLEAIKKEQQTRTLVAQRNGNEETKEEQLEEAQQMQ